jgi:hypothetical protein
MLNNYAHKSTWRILSLQTHVASLVNVRSAVLMTVSLPWCYAVPRTGPRYLGASSNRYSFNFFGLRQDWRNLLRARAQIADNFRRNSFACENPSSLAPYFRLFQWRLSALYRWHPGQMPGWPARSFIFQGREVTSQKIWIFEITKFLVALAELIILFQQMHYTILVFSWPYICFGTPCAILRGVVESSQFSMHPIHFHSI